MERRLEKNLFRLKGVSAKSIAARTWQEVRADDVFGRAAQLAYYFFLARAVLSGGALNGVLERLAGEQVRMERSRSQFSSHFGYANLHSNKH